MSEGINKEAKLPRPLCAKYTEDFAYKTVKDRMPVILTKVIDTVYRLKNDAAHLHGQVGLDDLKLITAELSQLKNFLQTDKPLTELTDSLPDAAIWNQFLEEDRARFQALGAQEGTGGKNRGVPSWFGSAWLYVECYMYRKIASVISQCTKLKDLDPFREQKQAALTGSAKAVASLTEYVHNLLSGHDINHGALFDQQLHVSLWGNKCDLSISAGAENHQTLNPLAQLEPLARFILHDDTSLVWKHLQNLSDTRSKDPARRIRIDIVLDNAGFELVTDLCLAELLITRGLADVVHFHAKAIPWFVSDVTLDDWNWTLSRLSTCQFLNSSKAFETANTSSLCREASVEDPESHGSRWKNLILEGKWIVHAHTFWTLPHDFSRMSVVAPDLHLDLSKSDLILFKGDLNYRKLVGDLHWSPTDPFVGALRGFSPAPLVVLRTLKCDVVVGLVPGKAELAAQEDSDWMLNGSYGVIQFHNPSKTDSK